MSLSLVAANTQSVRVRKGDGTTLLNLVYPFTMAAWVYPTQTGVNQDIAFIGDTATTNNYYGIRGASAGWAIAARGGGTENVATVGTVTANAWHFVMGRFVNATNRRIDVLQPGGVHNTQQSTTSRTSGAANVHLLGQLTSSAAGENWGGYIAEYWCMADDVVPGAQGNLIDDNFFRYIAYAGPLNVPHVASKLLVHASLRTIVNTNAVGMSILPDATDENFGGFTMQLNSAGAGVVTAAPHPPLPYWHAEPNQYRRFMVS